MAGALRVSAAILLLPFAAQGQHEDDSRKLLSREPMMTYHVAWSPDGRYIAFSTGEPLKGKNLKGLMAQCPGVEAPGWNTCVCDVTAKNRWVALTSDGLSNKEADWVPTKEDPGKLK